MQPTNPSPFRDYTSTLNTFGFMPPNTYFHQDSEGFFIPTGGNIASNIPGAQSIANVWHWRSPQETIEQINNFCTNLLEEIARHSQTMLESDNLDMQSKIFRQFLHISQRIYFAIEGVSENCGLNGAIETYSSTGNDALNLATTVENLKNSIFKTLQNFCDSTNIQVNLSDEMLRETIAYQYIPEEALYCPEEYYTDEEWEAAILESALLQEEPVSIMQYYGRYTVGLSYNQFLSTISEENSWDWSSEIGDYENGSLFLSALPVISPKTDSLRYMHENGIGAVLSVTEVFETHSQGSITSPILPETYAENGIKHLQIPTPDCQPVYFQLVARGVEFVHWCLKQDISVLIHCKAGRGRSFLILACYLIKYHGMAAQEAFDHIKSKRAQSGFNKTRGEWDTMLAFDRFYNNSRK